MKKFEIIEEGRLSKSEMGEIIGGGKTLHCQANYTVTECELNGSPASLSSCPTLYLTCNEEAWTCGMSSSTNGSYSGPTGPGGLQVGGYQTPIGVIGGASEEKPLTGLF
jgi:hypothetical protein